MPARPRFGPKAGRPKTGGPKSGPPRLVAFNKPMNVLSQFTDDGHWPGLGRHLDVPGIYPAGRLDRDSEGLLLLTNDGTLQARIADPRHKWPKTYLVQVEGAPDASQIRALEQGVTLKDGPTLPASVRPIDPPDLWHRDPPVRLRQTVPDGWLQIVLREGRNRQIRRMTAHVGLPTLRLVRVAIGPVALEGLEPGAWRDVNLSTVV